MIYQPKYYELGSKRLYRHDYSQPGAYFITICVADRLCIFGEIVDGEMRLNKNGLIVAEQWAGLAGHYLNTVLDEFVIMPNHVHGIICLTDGSPTSVGAGLKPVRALPESKFQHGLPEIIRGFKTFSALGINRLRGTSGQPVWQRNYYEHVVRAEGDLERIRRYISENPLKWTQDQENPVIRRKLKARHGGLKTRTYGSR